MLDGDVAALHPSAQAHFRGDQDGAPQVVEVDAWVDRLWFDLVSRNMIASDRSRPARHLIAIRPDDMARDLPVAYARKTFEENFAEYLRKVRRLTNPDRFALYSVSEVIPERFGSVVLRGNEDVVFDPNPRLKPNLIEIETDELAKYRPLANALNDAYLGLTRASPSAAGLAEFSRLVADASVTEAYQGTDRFDLARWLSINSANANADRQALIGAPYIHRNIEFFTKLIDRSLRQEVTVQAGRKEIEIWWIRPGGSAWGCSPEIQEAIVALRVALRRKHGKIAVRTKLISPRRDNPRNFDRVFDEGYIAPPGYLSPSIEVVYIPGAGTMVAVSVAFSDSVSAFVGYAATDAASVDRVQRMLRPGNVDVRLEELWNTQRREEEEPARFDLDVSDDSDT
jgi:hypothetical protein